MISLQGTKGERSAHVRLLGKLNVAFKRQKENQAVSLEPNSVHFLPSHTKEEKKSSYLFIDVRCVVKAAEVHESISTADKLYKPGPWSQLTLFMINSLIAPI